MLEKKAKTFLEEIRLAKVFRDAHLMKRDEMYDLFAGPAYRDDIGKGYSENHPYEFLRLTTAAVIHHNPRTRVRSRMGGEHATIAKAMQLALNRWSSDVDLRRTLKLAYRNMCFDYAIVQVVNEEQTWMDPRGRGNAWWPDCHLIDSDRFFFDPLCQTFEMARYSGHDFLRDKEDILQEAEDYPDRGWNKDAIEAISEDTGIEDFHRERRKYHASRNEIVLHEVWVPEFDIRDPDDGYHGAILTLAEGVNPDGDKKVEWIREPRAFYGPRHGPYVMFGAYSVPNDPYPLSPFMATWRQQQQHNEIADSIHLAIIEYAKFILVDASNRTLGEAIGKTKNSFVQMVPGLSNMKDQVATFEKAGITTQHQAQQEYSQAQLDRNSGINQAHRGNLSGATATEVSVAEEAKNVSLAGLRQEFGNSTKRVLESAGFHLYHDDRSVTRMGEDVDNDGDWTMVAPPENGEMQPPQSWFFGGNHLGGSGGRYEDLELELEPYSMERSNTSLAEIQFNQLVNTITSLVPVVREYPELNAKLVLEKGGDAMNDTEFAELIDVDLARQMYGVPGQPGKGQVQFSKQSRSTSTTQGQQSGGQIGGMMGGDNGKT